MDRLTFFGSSDDLIYVGRDIEMLTGMDMYRQDLTEFGAWNAEETVNAVFQVGEAVRVLAIYGYKNGCWSFGVSQMTQEEVLPDWNFEYEQFFSRRGQSYSVALHIDVPEGTEVKRIDN